MQKTFFGGTVYPKIKDAQYTEKEFFFGQKMTLTLPRRFYDKKQIALFCELFSNFTASVGRLKVVLTDDDFPCAVLAKDAQKATAQTVTVGYHIEIDSQKAVLSFLRQSDLGARLLHLACTH